MRSSLIILKSMIDANKAKYQLDKLRINSAIEKITTPKGCGYGLRVYDDPDHICRVLSAFNIYCVEIRSGGGR